MSALSPQNLKLKKPEKWIEYPNIIIFLTNTNTHSIKKLLAKRESPSNSAREIFVVLYIFIALKLRLRIGAL